MGHLAQTFQGYTTTVSAEWPALRAAEYHSFVVQFDGAIRKYPEWRAFKKDAASIVLQNDREAVANTAVEVAEPLLAAESSPFIDPEVPQALMDLAQSDVARIADQIVQDGADLLATDLLQSISNVLNPVAVIALNYSKSFLESAGEQAAEQGKADGAKAVKWARNIIVTGVTGGGLSYLIATYPNVLGWLKPVGEFLLRNMPM